MNKFDDMMNYLKGRLPQVQAEAFGSMVVQGNLGGYTKSLKTSKSKAGLKHGQLLLQENTGVLSSSSFSSLIDF